MDIIRFYNEDHPHSKNNYKTPSRKEAEYFSKQAENMINVLIVRGSDSFGLAV